MTADVAAQPEAGGKPAAADVTAGACPGPAAAAPASPTRPLPPGHAAGGCDAPRVDAPRSPPAFAQEAAPSGAVQKHPTRPSKSPPPHATSGSAPAKSTRAAVSPERRGDALRAATLASGAAVEDNASPITPACFLERAGLRFALPYWFDFRLHAKKRMAGRHPVDVFAAEFPVRPRAYYEAAYAEGRLRVEGPLDRANGGLRPGQCVRHFVHRHEPPVPAAAIPVLACTAGLVAVHKPACTPVHVAGQYRKNTVLGILEATRPDLGPLHPVHRLDKPVSGVLLLSRDAEAAEAARARITAHRVEKVYLARVEGSFPEGETLLDSPLIFNSRTGLAAAVPSSHPGAKAAATAVTLLRRDVASGTSLVEVRPRTGRSHQIRAHLGACGHAIANDHDYGGTRGTPRAQWLVRRRGEASPGAPEDAAGVTATPAAHGVSESADARITEADGPADGARCGSGAVLKDVAADAPAAKRARTHLPQAGTTNAGVRRGDLGAREAAAAEAEVPPERRDAACAHCPLLSPRDYPLDLQPLWLHAARYACEEWDFSAPAPDWAAEGFHVGGAAPELR